MLQVKEISLDQISLKDDFVRLEYSADKYNELLNSIRQVGILYPLMVLETDKELLLISGYRRFQAAKELGFATAPCFCLKTGIDDAEILRMHENLYREDVSPLQEAVCFIRLERTYHFTREKIAKLIGKSKAYITQRIQILSWPDNLQQSLSAGHVSYSIARELSAVTEQTELTRLLELAVQSGATVRTVLSWVNEWKVEKELRTQQNELKMEAPAMSQTAENNSQCFLCGKDNSTANLIAVNICKQCMKALEPDQDQQTTETPKP